MHLDNSYVLVTGGSRGIGRAIVLHLMSLGYSVAFTYKADRHSAERLVQAYPSLKAFAFDAGDKQAADELAENLLAVYGRLPSYLVNNAAMLTQKPFSSISIDEWDEMLQVNLASVFRLTQLVSLSMQEKKFGRIVNMSSIGGQVGGNLAVHYSTTKAGLISFTKSMARVLSRDNVLTNAIAPGLVDTDMVAGELNTPEGNAKLASIPVGKMTSTEEVARLVAFLLSKENQTLTGQTINLNGGMYFG